MIKQLVVNGCSYMEVYAGGNGHVDLANRLGIAEAHSLAIAGSANSRIIRTTLKHSYQTDKPTLYVMGLTFVSRSELPIMQINSEADFEGRWVNPQNQQFSNRWEHFWSKSETEKFIKFKQMIEVYSLLDRTEDLMYTVLAAIDSLKSRGHAVLVYQQADDSYQLYRDLRLNPADKLRLFGSTANIIDSFNWCAVQYQHANGVMSQENYGLGNFIGPQDVPANIRHPAAGSHNILNEFLVNYINDNRII